MKTKRRLVVLGWLMIGLVALGLTGCGSENEDVVGTWVLDTIVVEGYEASPKEMGLEDISLVFDENAQVTVNVKGSMATFSYSVSGDQLTFSASGVTNQGTIDGDSLTFEAFAGVEKTMIFLRE